MCLQFQFWQLALYLRTKADITSACIFPQRFFFKEPKVAQGKVALEFSFLGYCHLYISKRCLSTAQQATAYNLFSKTKTNTQDKASGKNPMHFAFGVNNNTLFYYKRVGIHKDGKSHTLWWHRFAVCIFSFNDCYEIDVK